MGDFLLDLRSLEGRHLESAAAALRFIPGLRNARIDRTEFGLVLTFSGDDALWAPRVTEDGSVFAMAGVPAFDESEWREAETVAGPGGLAGKVLESLYREDGLPALERVSGNCVLLVFDAARRRLHLVTDRAGAFPVFECETGGHWLFGSHPDVLARAAGEDQRRDEISLAEFLIASTVTPPFTYYERVRAVDPGCVVTIELDHGTLERRNYFAFEYQGTESASVSQLAEELADAWQDAVRRRTFSRLGTAVVALSGGLDSRLLLACLTNPAASLAFTCYDQPNRELETAARIAAAARVRFLPLQRGPDYYAENAELGVRVSGGMGTIANNHFLGVLDRLHAEGMRVLLTGCYCDYLFKGLPLNRRSHWLTGRERLAPFSHQFYFSQAMPSTPIARQVRERWDARFPAQLRSHADDARIFELEVRRTFPLAYEGDNQQRVVPQRLTGWSLTVADRRLLEIYRRIPAWMKLNRLLFLKTARILLAHSPIGSVPDANSGAPLDASPVREWAASNWLRLKRRLHRRGQSLASDGSWPDWHYYLTHSPKLAELWRRPHPESFDFFCRVMGWKSVPREPADFRDGRVFRFVPLLTQKLWFENSGDA